MSQPRHSHSSYQLTRGLRKSSYAIVPLGALSKRQPACTYCVIRMAGVIGTIGLSRLVLSINHLERRWGMLNAKALMVRSGKGERTMSSESRENRTVPIGTPVIGFNGEFLGVVREAYPHFLLIGREGEHDSLEIPVHSITGIVDGKLQVSVTRGAVT